MRTSKFVTLAAAVGISVLLFTAAAFFPMNASEPAATPEAAVPASTTNLEPVVVVATR